MRRRMTMKLKCKSCGAAMNKHDTVCPSCGAEVEPAKKDKPTSGKAIIITLVIVFVLVMVIGVFGGLSEPMRGYYEYDGRTYYYQKGVWYTYGEYGGWFGAIPDAALTDNYKEYYKGNTYKEGSAYKNFVDSEYYIADGSVGKIEGDTGKGS